MTSAPPKPASRLPGRRSATRCGTTRAPGPPSGLPSTMGLRLVAAISGQLRRISGPGPGQPALWLTACAEPSAEVTANAALVGRIGEGPGWALAGYRPPALPAGCAG